MKRKESIIYPFKNGENVIGIDPIRYDVAKKRATKSSCVVTIGRGIDKDFQIVARYEGRPEKTSEDYKKDIENMTKHFQCKKNEK